MSQKIWRSMIQKCSCFCGKYTDVNEQCEKCGVNPQWPQAQKRYAYDRIMKRATINEYEYEYEED